jgi:hypothetical protein
MKSNYKQLSERLEAYEDGKRCGTEFIKLCDKLPNLGCHEANFRILMGYFLPDHLLFDALSGREAIENDASLRKQLAWRTDEEIVEDNEEAIGKHNEALVAKPISELHKELKQRDREFRENSKPKPPASLTREAFKAAPPLQMRKWLELYGDGLNAHWARLEAGNV